MHVLIIEDDAKTADFVAGAFRQAPDWLAKDGFRYLDITDPDAWKWYLDEVWQPLLDFAAESLR